MTTELARRLFTCIDSEIELNKLSNAELADLLLEHVWSYMDMTGPKSVLVGVVIERLRQGEES